MRVAFHKREIRPKGNIRAVTKLSSRSLKNTIHTETFVRGEILSILKLVIDNGYVNVNVKKVEMMKEDRLKVLIS